MFDNTHCYKLIAIFVFIFIGTMFLSAKTSTDKNNISISSPSSISLRQAEDNKYMTFINGMAIGLPKIEKAIISTAWALSPLSLTFNTPAIDVDAQKEMRELSDKLGIKISNTEYLDLYREAAKWIGTRYRWAGKSTKGVDCSGLTGILLKNVYNKEISRSSHVIANELEEEFDTELLRPGDLVFFATRRAKRINHVGVYLGDGQFIHASRKGVKVDSLEDAYYARSLRKAGRI